MAESAELDEFASFVRRYDAARNAHDAQRMSEFFADDGDLIGATGRHTVGKDAIRALFAGEHETVYRDSVARRTVERAYRCGAEVAIITGRFSVQGSRAAGTNVPIRQQPGFFTLVVKRGGVHGWQIVAYRSMVAVDVFSSAPARGEATRTPAGFEPPNTRP